MSGTQRELNDYLLMEGSMNEWMTNQGHAHEPVYLGPHRAHLGLILSLTQKRGSPGVISSLAQQIQLFAITNCQSLIPVN